MPPIGENFPTSENLRDFSNSRDLIRNGKFPVLSDRKLHIIVGIKQANLMIYNRIRTPVTPNEPYFARCKLGWTAFGSDPSVECRPPTRCNVIRRISLKNNKNYNYSNPNPSVTPNVSLNCVTKVNKC